MPNEPGSFNPVLTSAEPSSATGPGRFGAEPVRAAGDPATDPTLTLPKVQVGAAGRAPAAAAATYDALRERLQRAALLARQDKAGEALAEFEAVYTNYLTLGDVRLAPIGVKAAYNRAVLLEKLMGDAGRAEVAFEKLYTNFSQLDGTEVRTVVGRAGLHAARLAGVLNRVTLAVTRYGDRLGLFGDLLPPLELRGFIADYRRLRAEVREHQSGTMASSLPNIVDHEHEMPPSELAQRYAPMPLSAAANAVAAHAAAAQAVAGTDSAAYRFAVSASDDPAARESQRDAPVLASRIAPDAVLRARVSSEDESRPSSPMRPREQGDGAPLTPGDAAEKADSGLSGVLARLEAIDRRIAAHEAEIRSETSQTRVALSGAGQTLNHLHDQQLHLRGELRSQHDQLLSDLQARLGGLHDDLRSGLLDARADMRALAAEQRSTRNFLTLAVVLATAIVCAVLLLH